MKRDLPHLIGAVFNSPLMIQGAKLDTILSAVGARILAGDALQGAGIEIAPRAGPPARSQSYSGGGYLSDDGIAVLPVFGTLIRRGSWLDSVSGMTSYASLERSIVEAMSDKRSRGVMLEVDSFGGEAGGVFDLARFIRDASAVYGKPVWAIANEAAASAGYAIASAAEKIWLPQMGEVGSIGVVCAHVDASKADEKAGVKWTYIYSGKHKVDGNPHEPLPSGVKSAMASDIESIYTLFVDMVAQNRGVSADAIRATEAKMYRGVGAVEAGLADNVGTFAEAMNAFSEHLDKRASESTAKPNVLSETRTITMTKQTKTGPATGVEPEAVEVIADATAASPEPVAEAPAASAPAATPIVGATLVLPPAVDALAAERKRATDLTALGSQAARLGVKFDVAAAIANGTRVETARENILSAAAERDDATFVSAQPSVPDQAAANAASGWEKAIKTVATQRGYNGYN